MRMFFTYKEMPKRGTIWRQVAQGTHKQSQNNIKMCFSSKKNATSYSSQSLRHNLMTSGTSLAKELVNTQIIHENVWQVQKMPPLLGAAKCEAQLCDLRPFPSRSTTSGSISTSHDPNDDPHGQLQGGNDKKDTRWQEERGKRQQESR